MRKEEDPAIAMIEEGGRGKGNSERKPKKEERAGYREGEFRDVNVLGSKIVESDASRDRKKGKGVVTQHIQRIRKEKKRKRSDNT